jgi:hypothetical protein
MEGCHNDGVPNHNELVNLRWDTASNNQLDRIRHGYVAPKGEDHSESRLTDDDIRCIRAEPQYFGVGAMLSRSFSVSQASISRVRLKQTREHVEQYL